jgi:predicted ABC-type ATPase
LADARRRSLLEAQRSFVTESVFSHPGRLSLVNDARKTGYQIWVTFVCVEGPELSLARVAERVSRGGHDIPSDKVRARYRRLFPLCAAAVLAADRSYVVDNSSMSAPLRDVMAFERGTLVYVARDLPGWARQAFARPLAASL